MGVVDHVGDLDMRGCLRALGSNMGSQHDLQWEAVEMQGQRVKGQVHPKWEF